MHRQSIRKQEFVLLKACPITIEFHFGIHDLILFVISYPTHKQFDDIATAIVKYIKLPLTKQNIVSLLERYKRQLFRFALCAVREHTYAALRATLV